MALDFPASPAVGAIYTSAGISWKWDGAKWMPIGAAPIAAANIALEVQLAANQTGLTVNTWNVHKYDTIITDTQGAYSASTGLFTPKQAGLYLVNATIAFSMPAGFASGIAIVKNGNVNNAETQLTRINVGANTVVNPISTSALIYCNGTTDTISVMGYVPTGTTTFSTGSAVSPTNIVNMVATLLQVGPQGPQGVVGPVGPQGPAGSSVGTPASVVLEVNLAANYAGTANVWNVVKYDTIVTDAQSGYSTSTGIFTPKVAGLYAVTATVGMAFVAGGYCGAAVVKNGSVSNAQSQSTRVDNGASGFNGALSAAALIYCNGTTDTISAQVLLSSNTQIDGSATAAQAVNMVATLLQIGPVGPQGPQGNPGAAGGITRHAIVSFKSSGTWTKQANLAGILVECWGGGGCGANAIGSPGGGGGGYARKWIAASALAASVAVTVGAGGVSTVASGHGGDTTFAHSTPIVGGGGKASSGSASVSSGGDEMFEGQFGNSGITGATVGSGGAAYMMGVAGVAGGTASIGPANSGGGGASGSGGGANGAGGSGYCRVTEYYLV